MACLKRQQENRHAISCSVFSHLFPSRTHTLAYFTPYSSTHSLVLMPVCVRVCVCLGWRKFCNNTFQFYLTLCTLTLDWLTRLKNSELLNAAFRNPFSTATLFGCASTVIETAWHDCKWSLLHYVHHWILTGSITEPCFLHGVLRCVHH